MSIPGSGFINGVAATADGTAYLTDTQEGRIYEISSTVMYRYLPRAPLNSPNGLAMDNDGNIVAVNIGDSAVITYSPDGEVVKQEH